MYAIKSAMTKVQAMAALPQKNREAETALCCPLAVF